MVSTGLKVIEVIAVIIICAGALAGNLILFVIVAKTPYFQTKGNVFILNLAVADLLVAALNMPIIIVSVISSDWILGETFCKISGSFTLLTFVASCMALSMIGINRYHAIVHWTNYQGMYTKRRCVLYIAIVWTITVLLSIPPYFGWAKFDYDPAQRYCFVEWSASKSYTLFMIAACLFGPLTTMSYCYVRIYRFHSTTTRTVRTASMDSELDNNLKVTPTPQYTHQTETVQSGKKLIRTIIILIMVFAFCWSPFAIIMILQVFFNVHVPRSVDFGSLVFGCLNSLLNVFVYNATNRKLRRAYISFLCCRTHEESNSQTQI